MARGERTENHPNRGVSRHKFANGGYVDVIRSPELQRDIDAKKDNAPAGGIPRPKLNTCTSCGEKTPLKGKCADCK